MDPGTIISVLEIVTKPVQFLARVFGILIDAPKSLTGVVNETDQLQKLPEFLAGIQREIPFEDQKLCNGQENATECRDTIRDLWDLVQKIQPSNRRAKAPVMR